MADVTKYHLVPNSNIFSDLRAQFTLSRTLRRSTAAFVYGVVLIFVLFTIFLAFTPSSTSSSSSPWFINFFTLNSSSPPATFNEESYRSHFSSIFSYIFPNSSDSPHPNSNPPNPKSHNIASNNLTKSVTDPQFSGFNTSRSPNSTESKLPTSIDPPPSSKDGNFEQKQSNKTAISPQSSTKTLVHPEKSEEKQITTTPQVPNSVNSTQPQKDENFNRNCSNGTCKVEKQSSNSTTKEKEGKSDFEASLSRKQPQNGSVSGEGGGKKGDDLIGSLVGCDLYDGNWVRDESYPLYKTESCPLIDEQFRCLLNGRPDTDYLKLKWKPKGCSLPRLNAKDMLERLRGKRLVFVGDSLNRNMWESLVCILRNSVKNKKRVYEAYGRHNFKSSASYSFVFKDYNCSVEFFVAPFLVQQREVQDKNGGEAKETLRLDLMVMDSEQYKDADFLVFNTGHWWTHDKTSKGEDYYQEGSHVYKKLDVAEAFRRAITTWARWIDANVNQQKTHVFFRGYSASHFRGGQWNSGGSCDSETEPIKNDTYLTPYPWKMQVFEKVIKGMKTPVSYLNVTKMTDYRKDGHPSRYRKHNSFDLKGQDCSHWCLPGVPDMWNELLYAEFLRKQYKDQQHKNKT